MASNLADEVTAKADAFYAWAEANGDTVYADFPDALRAFAWWLDNGQSKLEETAECDPEIYANGVHVAWLAGGTAQRIEDLVHEVARVSEQPVDWHYIGGRASLKTTGDPGRVIDALEHAQILILI